MSFVEVYPIEGNPIEVYPIEAYLIGKGVVDVSGCSRPFTIFSPFRDNSTRQWTGIVRELLEVRPIVEMCLKGLSQKLSSAP
jgi:hypothetical protein